MIHSSVEGLLAYPDTELHLNVRGQGREPIALVLNRDLGNYPLKNHIGTFERRPEICQYNSYISNYIAEDSQIKDFDKNDYPFADLADSNISTEPEISISKPFFNQI